MTAGLSLSSCQGCVSWCLPGGGWGGCGLVGKPRDTGPSGLPRAGVGDWAGGEPELGKASRERASQEPCRGPAAGGCGLRPSSLSLGPDRQEGRPHEPLWLRVVTGGRRWWTSPAARKGCGEAGAQGSPTLPAGSSPIPRLLTQTPPPPPIQGFEFQLILWGCKNALSAPALPVWEIRRSGEKPRLPGWGRGENEWGAEGPHPLLHPGSSCWPSSCLQGALCPDRPPPGVGGPGVWPPLGTAEVKSCIQTQVVPWA